MQQLKKQLLNYQEQTEYARKMLDFLEHYQENAFLRENKVGHFTASGFVLSPDETKLLLTHHKKLDIWIQLGGHSDGCENLLSVCLQEVLEESGLSSNQLTVFNNNNFFDIDIHDIPLHENKQTKIQTSAHLHFDVRFLLKSNSWDIQISDESNDLQWIDIEEIYEKSQYQSIAPMRILPKIKKLKTYEPTTICHKYNMVSS